MPFDDVVYLVPNAIVLVVYYLSVHCRDFSLLDIELSGIVGGFHTVFLTPFEDVLLVIASENETEMTDFLFLKELHQLVIFYFIHS